MCQTLITMALLRLTLSPDPDQSASNPISRRAFSGSINLQGTHAMTSITWSDRETVQGDCVSSSGPALAAFNSRLS